MQYEFKKFQVIWQCLSFGNVSAIGKPPHQSRGCYLESTKADWQYEYDFKRLSSILAILSFGPILVMFVLGLNCAIYLQLGIGWPPQLRLFSVKQCKLGNMNLIFQDISNILAMFAFWPRLSNVSAIGPPPHSTEAVCWKALCLACAVEAPTLVRRRAARRR